MDVGRKHGLVVAGVVISVAIGLGIGCGVGQGAANATAVKPSEGVYEVRHLNNFAFYRFNKRTGEVWHVNISGLEGFPVGWQKIPESQPEKSSGTTQPPYSQR